LQGTIPERKARGLFCHRLATIHRRGAIFAQPRAHLRLSQWRRIPPKGAAMKMLADFTFAAAAALAIGIAIGGAALSLVWLVAVLNA